MIHLAPIAAVAWLVALGILRLVFRREMAERPQHLAALASLDEKAALRDPVSVRKILIVLAAVILLFFLHGSLHLQPSVIALMGAAVAMLWVQPDVEGDAAGRSWSGVCCCFSQPCLCSQGAWPLLACWAAWPRCWLNRRRATRWQPV